MPYRITPRGDGGLSAESVAPDYEAKEDDVITEELPGDDVVWENGALRPKTEAEWLAEAKAQKIGEFAAQAIDDLAPLFTEGTGRDETVLLVASHVLKLCESLKVQPDPRLKQVVDTGQKALTKKSEVEAATSEEEVEAVTW